MGFSDDLPVWAHWLQGIYHCGMECVDSDEQVPSLGQRVVRESLYLPSNFAMDCFKEHRVSIKKNSNKHSWITAVCSGLTLLLGPWLMQAVNPWLPFYLGPLIPSHRAYRQVHSVSPLDHEATLVTPLSHRCLLTYFQCVCLK